MGTVNRDGKRPHDATQRSVVRRVEAANASPETVGGDWSFGLSSRGQSGELAAPQKRPTREKRIGIRDTGKRLGLVGPGIALGPRRSGRELQEGCPQQGQSAAPRG